VRCEIKSNKEEGTTMGYVRVLLLVVAASHATGFTQAPASGLGGLRMQLRGIDSPPRSGIASAVRRMGGEEGGIRGMFSSARESHTKYVEDFRARINGASADAMRDEDTDTLASVAAATAGMQGPERWAGVLKFAATHKDRAALEALWNEPEIAVEEDGSPVEQATAAVAVMAMLSGFEHSIVTAITPEILSLWIAQSAEFLAQGWAAYNAALVAGGSIGVMAKGLTSSAIMGAGDIIGQKLFPSPEAGGEAEEEEPKQGVQALFVSLPFLKAAEEKPLKEAAVAAFDPKRTGDFALVGAIIAAPIDSWYAFLGRLDFAALLPGVPSLVGKVMLDQLMWAPFCLASVFGLLAGLQGDGMAGWKEKMRTTWGKTVLSNWVLWIPAQTLNFLVIPPQLQLLYANLVGLGWNVYLSKVSQGEENKGEARSKAA